MTDVTIQQQKPSLMDQILDRRFRTTMVTTGCLVVIAIIQFLTGMDRSVVAGALIKPLVYGGQWWRLLSCAFLHGSILHIAFNGYALFNIGRFLEVFTNRGIFMIVYFLAVLTGSVFSLLFTPDGASLGASGGIIGLFGCLGVFAWKYRNVMPPGFLKSILYNLGLIAFIGYIGRGFIDNASHLGGLIAGASIGWALIPADRYALLNPSRRLLFIGDLLLGLYVLCSVLVLARIAWINLLLSQLD